MFTHRLPRAGWFAIGSFVAACGGGGGGGGGAGSGEPIELSYTGERAIYTVGVEIEPNEALLHGSASRFSVTPALPIGLVLDRSTGEIAGTPEAPAARSAYTVRASGPGGSDEFDVEIEVVAPARYVLVANSGDSTLASYAVDAVSGELAPHAFSADPLGERTPVGLCVHPSRRFVYAPNPGSDNVSVLEVDPATGWLVARAPVETGVEPNRMALAPDGAHAYVASRGARRILVYAIDTSTGALAPSGAPVATLSEPVSLAIDPSGRFLAVGLGGLPRSIVVYGVDPSSGALSLSAPPFRLNGGLPVGLAIDRGGEFVFATLENYDVAVALHIDHVTKALTLVAPRATGEEPCAIALHPSGELACVTNRASGSISTFRVDRSTGVLTPLSTAPAGALPVAAQFDPAGRQLFAVDCQGNEILAFSVDEEAGTLALQGRLRTRQAPAALAILQGDVPLKTLATHAYVANAESDDVSAFAIDPATGSLEEIGLAALAGDRPAALAVEPRGRFAYVANRDGGTLGIYAIDPASGALFEAAAPAAVGGQPIALAVEPSGRFLYSAQSGQHRIGVFRIDPASGALVQIASLALHDALLAPRALACDPTGQFLYVAAVGDGDTPGSSGISILAIDPRSGLPSRVVAPTKIAGACAVELHPSGRFLYAVLEGYERVATYAIDSAGGALSEILPSMSGTDEPTAVAVDPHGTCAWVAFEDAAGTGWISRYPIDAESGLSGNATRTDLGGARASGLRIDPTGRFLYAIDAGSNRLTAFRIDPQGGALAPSLSTSTGLEPTALAVACRMQ